MVSSFFQSSFSHLYVAHTQNCISVAHVHYGFVGIVRRCDGRNIDDCQDLEARNDRARMEHKKEEEQMQNCVCSTAMITEFHCIQCYKNIFFRI